MKCGRWSIRRLLMISVVALCPVEPVLAIDQPTLPGSIESVLWWFPEDTECLMVASGPLRAMDLEPREARPDDPSGSLQMLTAMNFLSNPAHDLVRTREIQVAITGGRRFRVGDASTGMMIPSDEAEIIVFREDLGEFGEKLREPHREANSSTEIIAGHRTFVEEIPNPNPDVKEVGRLYRVWPKPNILIHSTDRAYLETLLTRIDHRGASRALPSTLPEWKFIEPSSRFWAIRHFDRKSAAADPTSPFTQEPEARRFVKRDVLAVGLTVATPAEQPGVISITYSREGNEIPDSYRSYWNRLKLPKSPEFQGGSPNSFVVKLDASQADVHARGTYLLLIMTILGRGIII